VQPELACSWFGPPQGPLLWGVWFEPFLELELALQRAGAKGPLGRPQFGAEGGLARLAPRKRPQLLECQPQLVTYAPPGRPPGLSPFEQPVAAAAVTR